MPAQCRASCEADDQCIHETDTDPGGMVEERTECVEMDQAATERDDSAADDQRGEIDEEHVEQDRTWGDVAKIRSAERGAGEPCGTADCKEEAERANRLVDALMPRTSGPAAASGRAAGVRSNSAFSGKPKSSMLRTTQ